MNSFTRLTGVIRQNFFKKVSHTKNFFRRQLQVSDLPITDLTKWLVQQHPAVREGKTLAFSACRKQHRSC